MDIRGQLGGSKRGPYSKQGRKRKVIQFRLPDTGEQINVSFDPAEVPTFPQQVDQLRGILHTKSRAQAIIRAVEAVHGGIGSFADKLEDLQGRYNTDRSNVIRAAVAAVLGRFLDDRGRPENAD